MRYKIISSWLVLGQGLRVRIAAWLEYKEPDREVLGRGLWIGLYIRKEILKIRAEISTKETRP